MQLLNRETTTTMLNRETNTHMRLLHEDVISRIALLGEGTSRRRRKKDAT